MAVDFVTLDAREHTFRGRIVRPDDSAFDDERKIRNELIDSPARSRGQ